MLAGIGFVLLLGPLATLAVLHRYLTTGFSVGGPVVSVYVATAVGCLVAGLLVHRTRSGSAMR